MRWVVRGLLAVVGLIVVAVAVIYGASEWTLRKTYAVPMAQVTVPTDAASIAEGARLARIASCRDCHGANGEGKVMADVPAVVGTFAPPALARVAAGMSDAELVRTIRQGVHKDGRALYIMPSKALSHLSDEDAARIVAWIRSLKPGANDVTTLTSYGPIGRALILAGKVPAQVVTEQRGPARRPADVGGYYVAFACQACHKLQEATVMDEGSAVPALAPVVAAYDPAKLKRLLRTGVGTKPDHGIMSVVARESFAVLTDGEIDAIQRYLRGEMESAPAK